MTEIQLDWLLSLMIRKLVLGLNKTLPIPSLGLSAEFIITLQMWLGLPVFNIDHPPTCPCGSLIDQYGDHLLNCSHGRY